MMRASLFGVAVMLMASPSWAAELQMPDPALSTAEVVEAQLKALQLNDTPESDAGILQTWVFAHPDNKRVTGPLPRFAAMIKGPQYRMLLDHRSHEVEAVSRTDDEAVFSVTITSESGDAVVYRWRVAKVAEGELVGNWMTTAVSSPIRAGQAI